MYDVSGTSSLSSTGAHPGSRTSTVPPTPRASDSATRDYFQLSNTEVDTNAMKFAKTASDHKKRDLASKQASLKSQRASSIDSKGKAAATAVKALSATANDALQTNASAGINLTRHPNGADPSRSSDMYIFPALNTAHVDIPAAQGTLWQTRVDSQAPYGQLETAQQVQARASENEARRRASDSWVENMYGEMKKPDIITIYEPIGEATIPWSAPEDSVSPGSEVKPLFSLKNGVMHPSVNPADQHSAANRHAHVEFGHVTARANNGSTQHARQNVDITAGHDADSDSGSRLSEMRDLIGIGEPGGGGVGGGNGLQAHTLNQLLPAAPVSLNGSMHRHSNVSSDGYINIAASVEASTSAGDVAPHSTVRAAVQHHPNPSPGGGDTFQVQPYTARSNTNQPAADEFYEPRTTTNPPLPDQLCAARSSSNQPPRGHTNQGRLDVVSAQEARRPQELRGETPYGQAETAQQVAARVHKVSTSGLEKMYGELKKPDMITIYEPLGVPAMPWSVPEEHRSLGSLVKPKFSLKNGEMFPVSATDIIRANVNDAPADAPEWSSVVGVLEARGTGDTQVSTTRNTPNANDPIPSMTPLSPIQEPVIARRHSSFEPVRKLSISSETQC